MSGLGEILEENANLRESVRRLEALNAAQAEQIALLLSKVEALTASNERFAKHFEFLEKRRELAAAERFEAADRQSPLFAGLKTEAPARDPEIEKKEAANEKSDKHDRRKTATHPRKGRRDVSALSFPKRQIVAPVNPSTCEKCQGDRQLIEPRVSHRVGWEPGRFTVVEVIQQRCQCQRCPKAEIWTAPEPFLLPGAMCDDGLLARVIVDKFGDHLPLNRQADRMTREGFPINENVLCGWVCRGPAVVRLLVRSLREQVASAMTLLGDDSGLPVQDGDDGRLANGRLWVFTDTRQAFFAFSRTKEGEHPTSVLDELGVSGVRLLIDNGSEYNDAMRTLNLMHNGY